MEESESAAGDPVGIVDLLFSRYQGAAGLVLDMPYKDAITLVERASRERYEERLWQRWVAGPQHFMSFEDFRKELEEPEAEDDGKSVEEIMQKVESILDGTYEVEDHEDI